VIVLESKIKAKKSQTESIDNAIRTTQFIRNKCIRFWIDNPGTGKTELMRRNTQLRAEYLWCKLLNSHACQAAVERAWSSIARFFDNCKKQVKGKKGYPKFKKSVRSVEYKTSGWKLSEDRKQITFTDGNEIGTLKLIGTRDLGCYQDSQIKRVRLVRRADGYYCQFLIKVEIQIESHATGLMVGIDLGLKYFVALSNGSEPINAPKFYRKSERQLNRANRRKSVKFRKGQKQSQNYCKARKRYAIKHLRVSRQREEFCKRVAYSVIQSNDLVAYEDLNVKGLVKNRHLSKSISDAGWSTFRRWLEYFGLKYGRTTIAVAPHYTSQNCSNCGEQVKKALSVRTHVCPHCGYVADRDANAALNILQKATQGHWESNTLREIRPLATLDTSCVVMAGR
jgi:putative transposase